MLIDGGVFIVTGAGSGLGAATARLLAKEGGRVLLVDLNEEAARAVATEIGAAASFIKANVADEDEAESAVAGAMELGQVRGLVNCAGVAPSSKVLGKAGPQLLSDFARTININLVGSFNMLRLVADAMTRSEPDATGERGVIVNTASIAAFDGQIGQAAYAASKGGVVAMTLPVARELSRFGIRNMTIAPGIMETPMLLAMPPEVQESLGRSVPFPARMGRPEEFASLVWHIVTNSYLNGEVIRLDGAIRMNAK